MNSGPCLALLLSSVLLALACLGCPRSVTERHDDTVATPQETVDWFVRDQAEPEWGQFTAYWNHRAAEKRPFDSADRTIAGTVVDNTWTNEVRDEEAFYRALNTRKQEFRMVAEVRAISGGSSGEPETVRVAYSLNEGVGLTGWADYALAPGRGYLLLLQRQADGYRLVPVAQDGPPPIPITLDAAGDRGGESELDSVASLLLASLRAGDDELSRYAVPVLGHLAVVYGRQDAYDELLAVAHGDNEVLAVAASAALSAHGEPTMDPGAARPTRPVAPAPG